MSFFAKILLRSHLNYNSLELPVFFRPTSCGIPKNRPKDLKTELLTQISRGKLLDSVRIIKNGSLVTIAKDTETASELLKISKLINIDVIPLIQYEGIKTKFLPDNIPENISLIELAEALENEIKIQEVRRFVKRNPLCTIQIEKVLNTVFGNALPRNIKV